MPTRARSSTPLFFSRISWASRIKVRSTSEADISCAFSRISTGRLSPGRPGAREFINAASYACRKMRARVRRKPASMAKKLRASVVGLHEPRCQRSAQCGQHHDEDHPKKESERHSRRSQHVVNQRLKIRIGGIDSRLVGNLR